MVYSSIVSFYVPFMVTLLVYVQIYIVLRRRRKRVSTKRSSHVLDSDTQAPLKVPTALHPPPALLLLPQTSLPAPRGGCCAQFGVPAVRPGFLLAARGSSGLPGCVPAAELHQELLQ